MATTDLSLESLPVRTAPTLSLRGVVVATIAVGLGACLVRPEGGGVPWGDLAILGAIAATAMLGANEARRIVRARELANAASPGIWMSVIVGSQGPSETAGQIIDPESPPRNDPERRSLLRRARERRASRIASR